MKENALYLEVDEDITSAIDKLAKLPGESVQIVVPKRSSMLQSIINLKLLKKAAEGHGKEIVLVTGDKLASELASRVGLAVAPSLGAKAVLSEPSIPQSLSSSDEIIEADDPPVTPVPAAVAPVAPVKATSKRPPQMSRRELSDTPPPPMPSVGAPSPEGSSSASTGFSTKVPNFGRLQRRMLWIGLAAFLIVTYFGLMYVFASAKVTLYAIGNKVSIDTSFVVDPSAKQTDIVKGVLAGQLVTISKDLTGPFVPTGKKDVGTKATGNITVKNENDMNSHPLQAGTRFAAPDGKVFRSNSDVVVPGANPTISNGTLSVTPGTVTVDVTADQAGDGYNEGAARYTIPGLPAGQQAKIYGQGSQMGGGTSKTITVVSQSDLDTAKQALVAKDKDTAKLSLSAKVPTGFIAFDSSQTATAGTATSTPAVDAEGTTATATVKVTYTVLSVPKTDYQSIVQAQEQKQIGDKSQIYDDGLGSAQVTPTDKDSSGRQNFHLTASAYSGIKLNKSDIAAKLKGKRYGEANDTASQLPGIQKADIVLSPGWSISLPSRPGKINIDIKVADTKG